MATPAATALMFARITVLRPIAAHPIITVRGITTAMAEIIGVGDGMCSIGDYALQFIDNVRTLFLGGIGNWFLLALLIIPTFFITSRPTNSWKLGVLIS